MSFLSIRIVTRFLNSSKVPRKFHFSPFLLPICHCSSSASRSAIDAILNSVVKIFSFSSNLNLVEPWQKFEMKQYSGSGFVISGRRILTNAHVVDDDPYLQVRKHGSSTKYEAIVEAVGFGCDLALLVVDNEEFWEDVNPLELGDVPFIHDSVSVLGYPRGGDTISVTKGIVSRVEPREYLQSSTELLTIQTDAAIDYGNSGGPVVIGNKVAGVSFQGFVSKYKKINYMIPTPVIKHFLSCVEETGYYIGPGSLDISCQPMENAQIRKHFKMNHEMTGILVNDINPVSPAHKILEKNDIILAIDGVPIGNDETVPFREKERINFNHLVSMKKPGDKSLFKVLRDGREYKFYISYKHVKRLVPVRQLNPSYYIFAGFIFVPLSQEYLDDSNSTICSCALKRKKKYGGQIVIISQVLVDVINIGYYSFKDLQVKKVNGVELENMSHLRKLIKKCHTEELRLDLEEGKVIVLNYKSAREETPLIMKRFGILSAMSGF